MTPPQPQGCRMSNATTRRRRRTTRRWPHIAAIVYRYILATVAVAALVAGALALRDNTDEQRTQTRCVQALAYATTFQHAQATPGPGGMNQTATSPLGTTLGGTLAQCIPGYPGGG
jgi:hypothetical protein